MQKKHGGKLIIGFVFSILGLIVPIVFLIFSIIGFFLCLQDWKKNRNGLAKAGMIISVIGIIISLVLVLVFYLATVYMPEKDFQQNKVSVNLGPINPNADLQSDLQILMSRFLLSSGKAEGKVVGNMLELNISKKDFNTGLYRSMINSSLFEAKIGNNTIFIGGDRDIQYVGRTGQDAGIYSCNQGADNYYCEFRFVIYISEESSKRQAGVTAKLGENMSSGGKYLDKPLDLYIDNTLFDSLMIGVDLQGREITQLQISGSGSGETQQEAYENAQNNMERLQIIMISGELSSDYQIINYA